LIVFSGEKRRKKTGRRTGKGQGNEQDRREQIFCPFSAPVSSQRNRGVRAS
jgi:hypothetical protein